MRIDIVTVFPEPLRAMLDYSILRRARERGLIEIEVHDLRDWTRDKHRSTDDYPYGGGPGMVMKPEPVCEAVDDLRERTGAGRVLFPTPQGTPLTQALVEELAAEDAFIIVCGHYEGLDERARQAVITDEISVGDYVLTGGEIPALLIIDAVARQQPDVLGSLASVDEESFAEGLLEHPHYTRPREYRGMGVPETLLGGHHEQIEKWRRQESLRRTWERRPELLHEAALDDDEIEFIRELERGALASQGDAAPERDES